MKPSLPATVSLSLVSHTNAGKTTLARTLLGRDVGEVRDEAHVTEQAESHALVDSPAGDRLLLWDTPGFGDSQRLARRLQAAGSPLGWLMTQVWDRWRDRSFWASQQAIRHVLAQTDVALYLVNAAEAPVDAAYVAAELQILALLHKPVIVLLNQLGPPGAAHAEGSRLQAWRDHLAALGGLQGVLALDALARCWVQEAVLLQAVAQALPADRQAAMARLQSAWAGRQRQTWQAAIALLSARLLLAALDREPLPGAGWSAPLRSLGQTLGRQLGRHLGLAPEAGPGPQAQAMAALADRLALQVRRSTDALILLHGLQGQASADLTARMASYFARPAPVSEGRAALWGGLVTGALAGLKADIASGGLTLGGGLLAGGLLGALGAAGAVRGFNKVRGLDQPLLAWDEPVLQSLLRSTLLAYLAVAHHGRGRGEWVQDDPPPAWTAAVAAVLAGQQAGWQALWARRAALLAQAPTAVLAAESTSASASASASVSASAAWAAPAPADFEAALQALLASATTELLARLYPDGAALAGLAAWLPQPAAAVALSHETQATHPRHDHSHR